MCFAEVNYLQWVGIIAHFYGLFCCFAFVLPVQSAVPAFGSGSAQPVHKWRLAVALARPPGLLGWPAPLVGDLVEPAELEGGQTTAELGRAKQAAVRN